MPRKSKALTKIDVTLNELQDALKKVQAEAEVRELELNAQIQTLLGLRASLNQPKP